MSLEQQQESVPFIETPHLREAYHAPKKETSDFGEPWQSETGDFEIYSKSEHNATAYAENARIRDRIIKCVNATAGMTDPAAEIEAMRAAIVEAYAALGGCLKYILRLPLSGSDSECETMDDAHHALRKLKPFLP